MRIKINRRHIPPLASLVVLLVLPIFLGNNPYIMYILILCLIWAVVAAAWDLIMGYGGVFSFGQVAFFAIGAYTTALLTKTGPKTLDIGISPWLGLLLGGVVAAVVGILIALPCLRLRGIYPALVTFALHETLIPLILLGEPIGTGGVGSCVNIPPFQLGGYTFTPLDRVPSYYVALAISAVLIFVIYKVIHSSFGRAFVALRDDEPFAKSLGIDEHKHRVILFGISAFITGIAGAFYAHYCGLISHQILGLDIFILLLVMVIIGGLGRFPGAVIAAFIFTFANEFLRPLEAFRPVILGGIIIAAIIFTPQGLGGIPDIVRPFIRRTFRRSSVGKSNSVLR
jgi:branched-chain amino acid transport system permease protein